MEGGGVVARVSSNVFRISTDMSVIRNFVWACRAWTGLLAGQAHCFSCGPSPPPTSSKVFESLRRIL